MYFFDHLGGGRALLLLTFAGFGVDLVVDHGDDEVGGKSKHQDTAAFIGDVEQLGGDDALKQRSGLAFEHVEAEGGAQHTYEEDVALGDGEVEFAGHEGEHRYPINPDEGIDEVDDKALDENGAAARFVFAALEFDARLFAFERGDVFAEIAYTHKRYDSTADGGDVGIVKQLKKVDVAEDGEHKEDNDDIARANAESKGIGLVEAVFDAGAQLRKEGRAETEEQRQRDTADYAIDEFHYYASKSLQNY